jgi:uncharacterized protein (TIGR03083 family)
VSESSTAQAVLALLRADHDRFAAAIGALTDEQATTPSYDDDWSVAQVASHLGSGAEVNQLLLEAGRTGESAPGVEAMQPIWDAWNAKQPADQTHDAVVADAAFLARVDALTGDERQQWRLDLFGEVRDLAGLLKMRLSEHALHTWDIVVAFDPGATVPEDAVEVVVDQLGPIVGYTGQTHDEQVSVEVRTTHPERAFHLDLGPSGVQLSPSSDDTAAAAELTLPAEAFVRLIYGRLDPDHTSDAVRARGVDLGLLRSTFPGV